MTFLEPKWFGLLLGVAVLAAAYVVQQRRRRHRGVRFANLELLASVAPRRAGWRRHAAAGALGLALVGFAASTTFWLSLVLLVVVSAAATTATTLVNTLLQQSASDEMRGRVMSMFILTFIGAMPIGNLVAGAASDRYGAPHTFATGGLIIAVFVAVVTIRNKRLRELH